MLGASKIESSEYSDLTGVLRWFILLRWIAAVGVSAAIVVGRFVVGYDFPYALLVGVTALLIAGNGAYSFYFSVRKRSVLSRSEMSRFFHVQTICDYLFLFVLIYFTGFVGNPFVYFFVFHIMLTSFIFPKRTVATYVVALVAVFVAAAYGISSGILRYYPLFQEVSTETPAADHLGIRTFALATTLTIVAYLVANIKDRIEERGHRVELELDRYRSLDKAKSNFILQVTHELRGPLAALKGYHEMILKGLTGSIPDRTSEMLARADRRTRNLLNIIDEMIDFAYMKSEDDIDYTPVDLSMLDVLSYNADLCTTAAREKDIRIYVSAPKELVARANRDLLNIILGNLITNAVKYSPASTRIIVSAQEEEGEVHLMVKDQGIGIDAEDLERVFEEFYRARRAREIERDGTGLGLSIVQRAVNLLGGRIGVYSEVDRGTTFHIYLPKSRTQEME